jgi:lysophospholipase L1-like esterase
VDKKQGLRRGNALAIFIALALLQFGNPVFAETRNGAGEQWLPTWVTAPQSTRSAPVGIQSPNGAPAATPTTNPALPSPEFENQTIRMIVHTSIPGRRTRVWLSNAYGTEPLRIGAVHLALRSQESAIVPRSDRALTFSGKSTFTIAPGAPMVSDPVDLDVPQLGDLAVSIYLPSATGPATGHGAGLHATYVKEGDVTGQASIPDASKRQSYYFLTGVEVLAPAEAAVMVAFGDSITDGTRSTPEADSSWPSFLAQRLLANPATSQIAVLNEGISGNRITRDNIGTAGLARFDRDVLMQPGVKWVLILGGINDIGAGIGDAFVFGPRPSSSKEATPDDLIVAYRQMIERAHASAVKVLGGTLTPFEGARYYSEKGNVVRQAVNEWIRTSGTFDGVVDFDAIIRDPVNPNKFRAEFDSGDHLHPGDVGYKAMADAIDLSFFTNSSKISVKSKKE